MHTPLAPANLLTLLLAPLAPILAVAALFAGAAACSGKAQEPGPDPAPDPALQSSSISVAESRPATELPPEPEPATGLEPEPEELTEPEPAPDPFEGWGTYRVGEGEFRYPPRWRVNANAYGLSLIPDDHRPNAELISITAAPAPGVTSATAPSVAQALDGLMRANMPGMRRTGRPKRLDAPKGRSHARYNWRGVAPDGRRAEAAAWVVVESGQSAGVSIVADPATLRLREDLLARVAQSMRSTRADDRGSKPGDAQANGSLDPRLIGMFTAESIHSSNGVYVNTQLVTALGADGVAFYGAQSHINASQKAGDGGFRWTASGSSDGSVQRGKWSVSGNQLMIRWDTGAVSTYRYGFEPDGTLALRNAATGKLINIYRRLR